MATTFIPAFDSFPEAGRSATMPRPLPVHGGKVRDLLAFLRTQKILDDAELAAFAADIAAGRNAVNQPPGTSSWDS